MGNESPRDLGFRMPAEWEPHAATWLTWPHQAGTWPGRLHAAQESMCRWIRALTAFGGERVALCCPPTQAPDDLRTRLDAWDIDLDRVDLHVIATNDSWIRDYGPIFVTRDADPGDGFGTVAAINWTFDAWGGKGEAYYGDDVGLDDEVPRHICETLGLKRFDSDLILEGGAIEVNGAGTLMAARDCVLTARERFAGTAAQVQGLVEDELARMLGVEHFHWVPDVAFEGDDTDGHIDNLARFVGPSTIVTVVGSSARDPLHAPLQANLRHLQGLRDRQDRPYEVVAIPLPHPQVFAAPGRERHRYPASYANFYIGNHAVLVPTYADPNDREALDTLQGLFPGRQVIGIDCCDYLLGLGAIHCSTQQQPRPPSKG